MGKEIITITGALGSGKSVVGRAVAERLSMPYFSTGDLLRALAARKNMTILELNRLAETQPEIDHEIDGMMQEYAEKNERCVLDSRLAWHFVPYSFRCYLHVHEKIAAERIMGDTRRKSEGYESVEEAYQAIAGRKASEDKRFADLYGLRLSDFANYDLVVDTSVVKPEPIADTIAACFRQWARGAEFDKYWASPKALFPTLGGRSGPLRVADGDGFHFVAQGHETVSEAIRQGTSLLSYEPVAATPETSPDIIEDWEKAHGFEFFHRPLKQARAD